MKDSEGSIKFASVGKKGRKCICDRVSLLKQITGNPKPLSETEINKIRLNLFTERNSDGTGYLIIRGNDIIQRFGKRLNDKDIRAIVLYVRESKRRITKLDLSYNRITDKGFRKLLRKLLVKGRSSIIDLNIMSNKLTAVSIEYLAKYAQFMKLRYLRLNGNHFGTKGGEHFAKFLLVNDTVEFCDIGETNQTLSSVSHIITALRNDFGTNKTLKVFDFSRLIPVYDKYDLESKWLAYHLEFLFSKNETLVELHLQKNELIGHDMEYLVRGLKSNHTLLYLDLGYNKIGNHGTELLANYLKEKPQLLLLILAGNGITDLGGRALSLCLPYSRIRALDVADNRMTDDGILDLLNTIKKPFFMRFLNIWGNKFGHETCLVIERMLMSGVLFQHTMDVTLYEVDGELHAAYHQNPADRNKHLYYCEMDFGEAMPICHIKRNEIIPQRRVKVDCSQRQRLDKTNRYAF